MRKRGHPTGKQQGPTGRAPGSSFAETHGAYTVARQIRIGEVDGRTKLARGMKAIRQSLYEHVGGAPTVTQQLLIERVVHKLPVLEAMEQYRFLLGNSIDPAGLSADELIEAFKVFLDAGLDSRYKSFCDSFRADLVALGLKQPDMPAKDLAEYIKVKDKGDVVP